MRDTENTDGTAKTQGEGNVENMRLKPYFAYNFKTGMKSHIAARLVVAQRDIDYMGNASG